MVMFKYTPASKLKGSIGLCGRGTDVQGISYDPSDAMWAPYDEGGQVEDDAELRSLTVEMNTCFDEHGRAALAKIRERPGHEDVKLTIAMDNDGMRFAFAHDAPLKQPADLSQDRGDFVFCLLRVITLGIYGRRPKPVPASGLRPSERTTR